MKGLNKLGYLTCFVVTLATTTAMARSLAASEARILWRDPGPIESKDLYWGPGSADGVPKPPFTLVKEDTSGTKPKVHVTDAAGTLWIVKFATSPGNEVHAEIAASRIVWAFGYFVEDTYFVPEGSIAGVKNLQRAASSIAADGSFRTARFEKRPVEIKQLGRWDLGNNPFVGSRELSGLKMLIMLLNNWDARSGNAAIVRVPLPSGVVEDRYILSDLGTAFGRMGEGLFGYHSRWNREHYERSRLIRGVLRGQLEFHHPLNGPERVRVPLEHARWFSELASRLSLAQIRQAFEASGASPQKTEGFSTIVKTRIDELRAALRDKE